MNVSIGDLSQTLLLKRHVAATKTALQAHATEVATGRVADIPAHLRGDLSALAGFDTALARLSGHRAVATEAAMIAQVQQTALGQVSSVADAAASRLITAAQGGSAGIDAAARAVAQDFRAAIAALSLRHGDRAVFAGIASDGPAMAGVDAIIAAAMDAISGAVSADEVSGRLGTWFDDPAGFQTAAYRGAAPLPPLTIAPDDAIALDITAADPSLRDTLRGLLAGALLAQGALSGNPAERGKLAVQAGEILATSATDRAHLTARLGQTEARIDQAQSRIAAETSALEIARAGLVEADPYTAATGLEDARSRLEALYTLTARISRLSLADYM